jgi:hypothetical protein
VKRVNPWDTPKDTWQYVTIPERDIYDHPFGNISVNEHVFKAGAKHYVPAEVADEVNRIMKAHEEYLLQLLQPRKRRAVLAQINKNSGGGAIF